MPDLRRIDYTFCSPECASTAIDAYLNTRRQFGEELKDKSPLIREQFNPDNPFTINSPRFVSERGIEYMITHALERSGIRKPREAHMSHGFRCTIVLFSFRCLLCFLVYWWSYQSLYVAEV
jgi:hypothetical protein